MRRFRFTALLAAVLLTLAACGNGDGADTTAANGGDGDGDEVTIEGFAFQPGEITVEAGTEITWTNQDSVSHTTTSDDEMWDSGALSSDETFSFTFDEPGTYSYICTIHPSQMQATVIVEG